MKISYKSTCAFLLATTLLMSCGGKSEEEKAAEATENAQESVADAMKAVAKQAEDAGKNGAVETVDFRLLKDLLPADADGLSRKGATGEKTGAMGFNISTAEGEYENADGSQRIEIDIMDAGGTGAMMGLAAWSMMDVDKETENGYEKTSTVDGNKCYEKFDKSGNDGEISTIVKNRFIVTVRGNGVSMDKIKAALSDVDLDKLADLK